MKPGELITTDEAKDILSQGGYRRDDWPKINAFTRKVPATATEAVTLLARNDGRVNFQIHNAAASATLYVKLGERCSSDDWSFQIPADTLYEPITPCYTGVITAILASGTGDVRATELA